MDKKGDMPFWLAMTIFVMVGMILVLLFIGMLSGKMDSIYEFIDNMF
jgi:uncharacterized membrane protein